MPYGMQIRSASSGLMIDLSQTMLRQVASILVPYAYAGPEPNVNEVTQYQVPEFDDTRGMFIWRDYCVQWINGYAPVRHVRPFISVSWANAAKTLTVHHNATAGAANSAEKIEFIFLHYR